MINLSAKGFLLFDLPARSELQSYFHDTKEISC